MVNFVWNIVERVRVHVCVLFEFITEPRRVSNQFGEISNMETNNGDLQIICKLELLFRF